MPNGLGLGIASLAFPAVLAAEGCQKYLKSPTGACSPLKPIVELSRSSSLRPNIVFQRVPMLTQPNKVFC